MAARLTKLTLSGFKSIRRLDAFQPGNLTVLIGANGAGKSNLLSFFQILRNMMSSPKGLQAHLAQTGKAHSWLHDGPSNTHAIDAALTIQTPLGQSEYEFGLEFAAGDTLYFNRERFRHVPTESQGDDWIDLGAGHDSCGLRDQAERGDQRQAEIRDMFLKFGNYQFHNTSSTSRMRLDWPIENGRWLAEDGHNLAAFLYRLKNDRSQAPYYARIVDTTRQCLPFFADFVLEQGSYIRLAWQEVGTNEVFAAHQASDGMLRLMALVALLLQPEEDLPDLLILDEPELGLHPHAITTIAGLVKSVALEKQVILATQSVTFLNEFGPQDIVVVDRRGRESIFRRLGPKELDTWLERYTVGELWEKNIFGGNPA